MVSPLFLLASLSILYLVPEGLVRSRQRSRILTAACDVFDRFLDFMISLVALVVLSPVLLLVAVLVKLDSQGSVFYCQERVGKNYRNNGKKVWLTLRERQVRNRRQRDLHGRPFRLYKFRTMRNDAERHTGPVWAAQDDPRVTRLGGMLRSTYIDEIPQLINVLKGDMSLVGPRPERPHFTSQLGQTIPGYRERFSIKPGITGLAQVRRHADSSLEDVKRKLRYDNFYCQRRCLSLRMKIMASTARWILKRGVNGGGVPRRRQS
ncbi:hypothetical protein AMJ40_05415 [candidate division TA06 bacterium DG_26]|uniref:Bacterial sugar transferase domain-containing protein n=1 Tax=candidate division TA06 bacterium DG_26 TaxID=1703771 RepID=A0A0S7WH49_UNCT6|nr:MAG: hypothetical protein AMJ40_05415 [candidate division TA06 bacterium DG_26]